MVEYEFADVDGRDYLYVAVKCPMKPEAISEAIGKAFRDVMGFMQANAIAPAGPPLAVYYSYDPETVEFNAGFFVSAEDAGKAGGDIRAGKTPAGRVLTLTHVGPYRDLGKTYEAMMGYLQEQGLKLGAPTWEVYVDDPDSMPEEKLRTEIFVTLA